jgi:hypothetical protein
MLKPDLNTLLIQIKEGKEQYDSMKGKAVKKERRRIKAKTNNLIGQFNNTIKYKAIKTI